MPKKNIFGLTASIANQQEKHLIGNKHLRICYNYIDSIILAGGIPLVLPAVSDKEARLRQLDLIDVLILSGGSDLHPSHYQEEPSLLLEETIQERDEYELQLALEAYERQIPILGICRGLQLVNVAFGGTLYQDLSQHPTCSLSHRQKEEWSQLSHQVKVLPSSLLLDILGEEFIQTNSFHHQGIKQLAEGFSVNAYSDDGVIEGIERPGKAPILAVQWHPEAMSQDPLMLKLFHYFNSLSRTFEVL